MSGSLWSQERQVKSYVHEAGQNLRRELAKVFAEDERSYLGKEWFFRVLPSWNDHIVDWDNVAPGTVIYLEYPYSAFIPKHSDTPKALEWVDSQAGEVGLSAKSQGLKDQSSLMIDFDLAYALLMNDVESETSEAITETRKKSSLGFQSGLFFSSRKNRRSLRVGALFNVHQINKFEETYDLSYEWNFHLFLQKQQMVDHVSPFVSLAYDVFAYAVTSPSLTETVLDNEYFWLNVGFDLDFALFESKLTVLRPEFSTSLSSNRTLDNGTDYGSDSAFRFGVKLRQYMVLNSWLEFFGNYTNLGDTTTSTLYGVALGYRF